VVVGKATALVKLFGSNLTFNAISLTASVTKVAVLPPGVLQAQSGPVSLQFSAMDSTGYALPITAGSAIWKVSSGSQYLSVSADGIATPLAGGSAIVQTTVDGFTSAP